jgi:hypothetical protein
VKLSIISVYGILRSISVRAGAAPNPVLQRTCQLVMKKRVQRTRKLAAGIHGSRRPKKGLSKQITFWVSEEEKQRIEQAATAAGLSMSRFVMEKALKAAKKVLSQNSGRRSAKVNPTPSDPPSRTPR